MSASGRSCSSFFLRFRSLVSGLAAGSGDSAGAGSWTSSNVSSLKLYTGGEGAVLARLLPGYEVPWERAGKDIKVGDCRPIPGVQRCRQLGK